MTTRLTLGDPATARLVERQMRNWELARSQRPPQRRAARPEVEDFICVSRMVGVDDLEVANRLGKRLGWPVFDREVLEAMAGDDEIRQRIYASMDERDLSWWEEALRSLAQSEFVRNDYFHRLCQTLLSLARQGPCVFVGRGADLILPRDRGFRVRLVAPERSRVEKFARDHGMSPAEAAREVRKRDRERAEFFRHHFGVDANDPFRHDISINLDRVPIEAAAEMILAARQIRQRA